MIISNGQCEHPDCPWCARIWLAWLAARMRQMQVPRRKLGETVSFAEAASTSIKPSRDETTVLGQTSESAGGFSSDATSLSSSPQPQDDSRIHEQRDCDDQSLQGFVELSDRKQPSGL